MALQAEYTAKVQQANKILVGMAGKTKEYRDDVTLMANELAQKRGLIGTQPNDNPGA